VSSGVVEHRDHALTEAGRVSQMLLCVSRAGGTISLPGDELTRTIRRSREPVC
jgi:hypothetical protein